MSPAREYTWCKEYSMVFIDNPVGAGFSFTDADAGYATSMEMVTIFASEGYHTL